MVYFKRLRSSGFVSLEAFKMYYVMRTFAPSLHRKSTDFLINSIITIGMCSFNISSHVLKCFYLCLYMIILCRPIAGNANFCPDRILEFSTEDYIRVAIHELTHALVITSLVYSMNYSHDFLLQVFSSSLFPYFRFDDGSPQTPRDQFGRPRDEFNQYVT